MSGSDQPPPDERDDRTIFRPEPPRARPAAGAGEAAAGAQAPRDGAEVARDDHTVFRPNPAGRRPPPAERGGREAAGAEDAARPRKALVQGEELAAPDANPILRAASPLLLLLGRLRAALIRAPGPGLVAQIAAAIEKCDREMAAAGVPAGEANTAKFALCASADEVLAHLPGEARAGGARLGLMTRFFGENNGGRRFFDELDRAEKDSRAHFFLLELFYACLALCYQGGRQRAGAGSSAIAAFATELREILQKTGPRPPQALSPRWQGQPLPGGAVRLRIPLWSIAGLAGLALFGAFLGFKLSLGERAEQAATAIAALAPRTPVTIGRQTEAPPPPAPPPTPEQASQLSHLLAVLSPNILAGTLGVDASADQIVIRIVDRDLFRPGKSAVLDDVKPLMAFVALALEDSKGPVKVIGHSDNTPIANARFASNFELSLERAKVVGALLKQALSDPSRVVAEGKGADAPIASNDTPEGRAKNRRVEIVVPRSE